MENFKQSFKESRYRKQYKLIDGHIVEVGKIDLQELYNSMLPNALDSILKAFLEPESLPVSDSIAYESHSDSFEDLMISVNSYAEENNLTDLSFSELLNRMLHNATEVSNLETTPFEPKEDAPNEN